jgi:hypothetical protein
MGTITEELDRIYGRKKRKTVRISVKKSLSRSRGPPIDQKGLAPAFKRLKILEIDNL